MSCNFGLLHQRARLFEVFKKNLKDAIENTERTFSTDINGFSRMDVNVTLDVENENQEVYDDIDIRILVNCPKNNGYKITLFEFNYLKTDEKPVTIFKAFYKKFFQAFNFKNSEMFIVNQCSYCNHKFTKTGDVCSECEVKKCFYIGDKCAICQEDNDPAIDLWKKTKCDHIFHSKCLNTYFDLYEKPCPMCRTMNSRHDCKII